MGCCKDKSKIRDSQEDDIINKNAPHDGMIHADMTIEEILSSHPQYSQLIAQELTNTGLHCVGCQAAVWETLRAGMKGHGKTDQEVDALVIRLNTIISKKMNLDTITLTPRAAKKFLSILEEDEKQGWGLRIDEKMAGCNGFESFLDFSEKANEDDQIFESLGIEIHVNKKLVKNMLGVEIDYIDALHNSGFKISNPNVRSSCGCGSSYGY